jgi:YHS domain-containing protein
MSYFVAQEAVQNALKHSRATRIDIGLARQAAGVELRVGDNGFGFPATMKESEFVTKDLICGVTVDEATALHAERDGKTFYFCSDHCRQKFQSTPAGAKPEGKSGCCCG